MTKNNNINQDNEFISIEDSLTGIDVTNKDLMYQQSNATNQILQAIEHSKDDIKDTINSGIIEKEIEIGQNIDMPNTNCENCRETIQNLSTKYQLLDNNIANTNKILSIVGTVISVLLAGFGIALTIFIFTVNSKYDAINDSVNAKFDSINTEIKAINQRLDYQEKLNTVQIQRDVAIEIKNQKSVK